MPKCPKCGGELHMVDGVMECHSCGSKFKAIRRVQPQAYGSAAPAASPTPTALYAPADPESDAEKIKMLEQRLTILEAEKSEREQHEKQEMEQRLAVLEAEKYKREHRHDQIKAIGNSKAVTFVKRHWPVVLVGVLLLVVFITLMVMFVGLRGIYVNVNNSNECISFTATSYQAGLLLYPLTGPKSVEGKWQIKDNILSLSVKDDVFGDFNTDFEFKKLDGYKRISLDGVEYKRVSLIGIKTTQKKVKITFDPQNGEEPIVYKIKIGSLFRKDIPEYKKNGIFPFGGWYTEPLGQGEPFDLDEVRSWENATYYAYWEGEDIFNVDDNYNLIGLNCAKSSLPTELVIPDGVRGIGDKVFYNCAGITSVTIPDSVQSIGESAFENCDKLQTVTIGKSVKRIGKYAFLSCTGLQTVMIGEGVQSIDSGAFRECTSLKDIYYAGDEIQWRSIEKGEQWDFNQWNGHAINYRMHYNSTGPASASAEAEVILQNSVVDVDVPKVWAKQD